MQIEHSSTAIQINHFLAKLFTWRLCSTPYFLSKPLKSSTNARMDGTGRFMKQTKVLPMSEETLIPSLSNVWTISADILWTNWNIFIF
jgi:hypothetical protein